MIDTTENRVLEPSEIESALQTLHPDWSYSQEQGEFQREFKFKNYYKTIAFVNVLAWIAQENKHHPDLEVNYGRVLIRYTTHDLGGVSLLDLKCLKSIDQIQI